MGIAAPCLAPVPACLGHAAWGQWWVRVAQAMGPLPPCTLGVPMLPLPHMAQMPSRPGCVAPCSLAPAAAPTGPPKACTSCSLVLTEAPAGPPAPPVTCADCAWAPVLGEGSPQLVLLGPAKGASERGKQCPIPASASAPGAFSEAQLSLLSPWGMPLHAYGALSSCPSCMDWGAS